MTKLFDIILLTAIIAFVCWVVWWLSSRHWATEHIEKHISHYKNTLNAQGLKITDISGWDGSPCEVVYKIYGHEVSIKQDSFKTYKLLKKIKHRKISIYDLQMMSDTPYSKLPS